MNSLIYKCCLLSDTHLCWNSPHLNMILHVQEFLVKFMHKHFFFFFFTQKVNVKLFCDSDHASEYKN